MLSRLRWAVLLVAFMAGIAHAVAVIEFLEMGATDQYKALHPVLIGFLKAGYKNVPDNEFSLAQDIKKLAFEKGYTYQSLEEVAKEAALRAGMTR